MKKADEEVRAAFLSSVEKEGMREDFMRGVVVALSGGADSVALLHLMHEYACREGFYLAAMHVHHGIRGVRADEDERFAASCAASLGVPFTGVRVDVPAAARARGEGIEECARRERYAAFEKYLAEHPEVGCVVTAHNATDHLETVVLRLLRGAGTHGMRGIPARRGVYLRPLLRVPKDRITDACRAAGWEFVTDESNECDAFRRNYIRHRVLPLFREITPDAEGSVLRMTDALAADDDYLAGVTREALSSVRKDGTPSRAALARLHPAIRRRVLIALIDETAGKDGEKPERTHIESLDAIVCDTRRVRAAVDLPGDIRATCEYDALTFDVKRRDPEKIEPVRLTLGENRLWDGSMIILSEKDDFQNYAKIYKSAKQARLPFDIMNDTLIARPRQAGDVIVYPNIHKRVRRLYSEKRVPERLRDTLPVVCDGRGVLWIPGFAVAARARDEIKTTLNAYFCFAEGKDE